MGVADGNIRRWGGWRKYANCLGVDSDVFFVHVGTSNQEALRICSECSVQAECLAYAISAEAPTITYGVWAGRGTKELRRLRSRMLKEQQRKETHG